MTVYRARTAFGNTVSRWGTVYLEQASEFSEVSTSQLHTDSPWEGRSHTAAASP